MLLRLFRKMINNKRMVACLLIGLILAVAMISSIPIYTDGVLQRMLSKDLENYQVSSGHYPGSFQYYEKFYNMEKPDSIERMELLDNKINKEILPGIGLPIIDSNIIMTNDYLVMKPEVDEGRKDKSVRVEALKAMEGHINITHGRLPVDKKVDDTYEFMVSENALFELDLVLDKTYMVTSIIKEGSKSVKFKLVGVYTIKDKNDPYWMDGIWQYPESFIINYSLFNGDFMKEELASVSNIQWYYALNYHKIKIQNLKELIVNLEYYADVMGNVFEELMPCISILKKYEERAGLLKTTLWVVQVPVLTMIIFYLFMVSQLIIEQEKNEIAVLKSRGAARGQIVKDYLMQGIILCGIALVAGPLVGLVLCQVIGASSGFLQFVNRTRMPLSLNLRAYIYSLIGCIFFVIAMVLPALGATKTTIVLHKQKNARKKNKSAWKRYYIDVLLLAISLYGLYTYKTRQDILKITGASGSEIPIDPLLFLISTLFIIACGMVFLRIFPYMVAFLFRAGKKLWGPVTYSSLINASRSGGKDGFIILFLVLTISIGIFNANAARTINTNVEEKVKYSVGADIVIKSQWENDAPSQSSGPPAGMPGGGGQESAAVNKPVTYVEPPFLAYTQLEGVEMATKVFMKKDALAQVGTKNYPTTYVMGIESSEFGKTAWFRPSLLPFHWYEYLNVLAKDPTAFIVSSSYKTQYNAKIGDTIYVKWGENDYLPGTIYAFVDFWPAYNPYVSGNKNKFQNLVVANLSYIQLKTRLEPYEIWIKAKPEATSKQIYDDIQNKQLKISSMNDSKQQIISKKNDPMLQGTNGALTMGFIVTMVVSAIGFLIYWILSIEGRILQFGVLRAMGMSVRNVIGILTFEQAIISGSAIIVGIVAGGITSDLFIPLLQVVYASAEQVPPFKVAAHRADYLKLYAIILIMLVGSFAVLGRLISRIKINNAIKLGED